MYVVIIINVEDEKMDCSQLLGKSGVSDGVSNAVAQFTGLRVG